MHLFSDAFDDLNRAEQALRAESSDLTGDQLLKIAHMKALLSISQELSQIHHNGINPKFDTTGED